MPNITPEMMKMASQQLGGMSPEQIERMKQTAGQNLGGMGGMGGMPNQYQRSQTTPVQSNTSQQSKPSNKDIQQANSLKEEANNLYKQQKYEAACDKYYEAINAIRFNESLKNNAEARQVEIACRLNVALCKQQQNEYNVVIDQCEQVLEYEPKNWKACFRISNAMFQQTKGKTNIRAIHNYAKKALEGSNNDKKVKEFYDEVKVVYDKYLEEQKQQEQKEEEKKEVQKEEIKQEVKIEEPVQNYAYVAGDSNAAYSQPQQPFVNPMGMSADEKARLLQQNSERIKNMDDEQLSKMLEQIKNNKEQIKQVYKMQGIDMTDEQIESMQKMMNPEMLKAASQMISQNPDLAKNIPTPQNVYQAPPQQTQQPTSNKKPEVEEEKSQPKIETQEKPQQQPQFQQQQQQQPMNPFMAGNNGNMADMMSNMMNNPMVQQMMQNPDFMRQAAQMMQGGGLGNLDPNSMQNMMSNPSFKTFLDNPEMLNQAVNMMTDPKNSAMLDMVKQQYPQLNVDMMAKALKVIVKVATAYKAARNAWSNIFVRLAVFGILVMIIAYFFG